MPTSRSITVRGSSRNLSFDEALRNAISQIPASASPTRPQNVQVNKIYVETGGVVGRMLYVEVKVRI